MSYRVRTDSFEGPFDLLLYLVSRQKVDIGAINITEIADQYLAEVARLQNLDLDVASDFLLVERLLEYKQFKNAAAALHERFVTEGRMHPRPFGPDASFLELMPDFLRDVSLDSLALLAAQALARREVFLLESEHIAAKPIPVEVHVRAIHQRIKNLGHLRFSQLVTPETPKPLVVVTFLAVLELYKRSMVTVQQSELFGDIDIDYIEGSGELLLDGEDALTSVGEE